MADKPNRRAAAAAARELLRPKLDRITEIAEAARTIELAVQAHDAANRHILECQQAYARARRDALDAGWTEAQLLHLGWGPATRRERRRRRSSARTRTTRPPVSGPTQYPDLGGPRAPRNRAGAGQRHRRAGLDPTARPRSRRRRRRRRRRRSSARCSSSTPCRRERSADLRHRRTTDKNGPGTAAGPGDSTRRGRRYCRGHIQVTEVLSPGGRVAARPLVGMPESGPRPAGRLSTSGQTRPGQRHGQPGRPRPVPPQPGRRTVTVGSDTCGEATPTVTSRHHTRARPRQVDQHDQDAAAGAGERAELDPPAVEVDHPPGHEPSTSPAQQGVQIRQPKSVTANLRAAPPSGAAGARGSVPAMPTVSSSESSGSPLPSYFAVTQVQRARGSRPRLLLRVLDPRAAGSPGPHLRPPQFGDVRGSDGEDTLWFAAGSGGGWAGRPGSRPAARATSRRGRCTRQSRSAGA